MAALLSKRPLLSALLLLLALHQTSAELCINLSWNPTTQVCCNGVISNIPPGYTASQLAGCCGTHLMLAGDPNLCCSSNYVLKATPTTVCCGSTSIDTATQVCCNYRTPQPKYPTTYTYCCLDTSYDSANKICCSNNLFPRFAAAGTDCCGGQVYNRTTSACCSTAPVSVGPGNSCCGTLPFSSATHTCIYCGSYQVFPKSSLPLSCCSGVVKSGTVC